MIGLLKITETWTDEVKKYLIDETTTSEECPSGLRYIKFNIYRDRTFICSKPTRSEAHGFVNEQGDKAVAKLFEQPKADPLPQGRGIDTRKIFDAWKKERDRYDIHHDLILDDDGYNRHNRYTCLIYKDRFPHYKCATDLEAQDYIDKNCAQAVAEMVKQAMKPNFASAYHQRCSIKPHV